MLGFEGPNPLTNCLSKNCPESWSKMELHETTDKSKSEESLIWSVRKLIPLLQVRPRWPDFLHSATFPDWKSLRSKRFQCLTGLTRQYRWKYLETELSVLMRKKPWRDDWSTSDKVFCCRQLFQFFIFRSKRGDNILSRQRSLFDKMYLTIRLLLSIWSV